MIFGIKRKPAHAFGGGVAQFISGQAVGTFMHAQRNQNDYHDHQDIDDGKIVSIEQIPESIVLT